jgi:flagellar protein FlaJ
MNKRKRKVEDYHFLKKPAIHLFGKLVDKYSNYFQPLRESLIMADTKMLFRTYLSIVLFLTFLVFIVVFILTLAFSIYFKLNLILTITGLIIVPSFFSALIFFLYYTYPTSVTEKRKNDIEANLPFAINHMAAIAESGVPPRVIFKVISQFKEYGEVSRESRKIVRNIEVFGLDETRAIKDVASKTPSTNFKDLLYGILTAIQTGGSLKKFLREESERIMFEYKLRRSKYLQQLSIYADFYTALLVAAPFIFVIILPLLSVLGGKIFGLSAQELVDLGIYGLIAMNVGFLVFLQLTQPRM